MDIQTPIRKQLTFSQTENDIDIDIDINNKFDEEIKDEDSNILNATMQTNASSVYLSVGNLMDKVLTSNDTIISCENTLLSPYYEHKQLKYEYYTNDNEYIINLKSTAPTT
eukprot:296603_1